MDISEAVTGYPLDQVAVFDTETTGLDNRNDEILQLSIFDGTGTCLFSSYLKPRHHYRWPQAQRIHGISPDMVSDAPSAADVAECVRAALDGKLVVGYNLSFDIPFMVESGFMRGWPSDTFDVMTEFARVHGRPREYGSGYAWSKLGECAEHYGYSFRAHDAFEDARATVHCYRSLLCDRDYINVTVARDLDELREVRLSQTKATGDAVRSISGNGFIRCGNARLILGEITRGQNKGRPRYECYVVDECIGFATASGMDHVRRLFDAEEDGSLPPSIPCSAELSCTGKTPKAVAYIKDKGSRMAKICSIAEEGPGELPSETADDVRRRMEAMLPRTEQLAEQAPAPSGVDRTQHPEAQAGSFRPAPRKKAVVRVLKVIAGGFLALFGALDIAGSLMIDSSGRLMSLVFGAACVFVGAKLIRKNRKRG